MSNRTKQCKRGYVFCSILSVLLTIAPLIYYIILAFANGDIGEKQKATLGITLCIAMLLFAINVLMKYSIRSTVWIMLLGVYICLEDILPLILMIAVGTILDEFIVTPLKKHYRSVYIVNKEIDRRE